MSGFGVRLDGDELHRLTVFYVVPGVFLARGALALPESRRDARLTISSRGAEKSGKPDLRLARAVRFGARGPEPAEVPAG